jgi:hypothetical protein
MHRVSLLQEICDQLIMRRAIQVAIFEPKAPVVCDARRMGCLRAAGPSRQLEKKENSYGAFPPENSACSLV